MRLATAPKPPTDRSEEPKLEGISASAVSQRTVRDGLDAIVLAAHGLRAVR